MYILFYCIVAVALYIYPVGQMQLVVRLADSLIPREDRPLRQGDAVPLSRKQCLEQTLLLARCQTAVVKPELCTLTFRTVSCNAPSTGRTAVRKMAAGRSSLRGSLGIHCTALLPRRFHRRCVSQVSFA